ncbi:hypothetical protein Bca4012_007335 [Brassica carinata]|uniref:cyclin-dependent kinase n=3 Tax=Brassica TaxID=3705 RepID=A0A078F842_BRANA|nr:cyclin-dependent kinase F-4 isoform X1 [Brassica napus]XP_048607317.1 cyclin-dependent kinase F-4-like isoform X1 [Brassica napus]KAG2291390.1 hypothetical protein Bca52824_038059 [Brassica carinata]CDY09272.1 BnaC03g63020D [Brassica napus]
MDRYKLIKEVGDGTFGTVWRAINKQTGEVVAIKKMKKKYYSWDECINLREVKSLRRMDHPNIVKLKEVIREHDILYFVFEYMDYNLYQLMKDRQKLFTEAVIKKWCFQVFHGLSYMHQRGYFHRDLKPENLLVSKDIIKIADFGLAREVNSSPPFTEYVSTRWYRAPEVLLQSYVYTSKVDMWAMGAIMSELLSLRPIFPGASEADEIYKICSVIGSPTEETWLEGLNLANTINYQFPQLSGVPLSSLMPSASEDAIDLITRLCSWDPCKRPTAAEALQHPFFQSCFYVPPSLRPKPSVARTPPPVGPRGSFEHQTVKRQTVSLAKPFNNVSPKPSAAFGSGVQRKLDMAKQDGTRNTKPVRSSVKDSKYRPPGRKSPPGGNAAGSSLSKNRVARGVSETADKLSNMSVRGTVSRRHSVSVMQQQQLKPPPMKAGCVGEKRDMFLRPTQPATSAYSRKVAG